MQCLLGEFAFEGETETEREEYGVCVCIRYCLEVEDYRVCFGGEIDIGLDIITVFRVLFIFNNFIFINNADVENCGSFKSFGYIYIYIIIKEERENERL